MADIIKLHDLRPAEGANKAKTRVGRGEASKGKTAGRGTKGTKARKQVSAAFEGGQMPLHMRLPKLKGFKNNNKIVYQVVNVADLAEAFPKGGTITTADIAAAGLVRKNRPVKVLGDGEISVKLDITAEKFSKSAAEKIAAAGGSTTEVADTAAEAKKADNADKAEETESKED
ncbi:50S ribosomal protein L15 [Corynebacterium sp. p3-SID1194]|uniref:50S ribosomal protein L15 n=1 Tax=Corynebacterium sp. p3-SID1194 TaxID=2916105 RepID=UPI0021A8E3AA|nr:50S ribosomal protein L15 [Corynebacterium sp. p3-SID1194]MCT1449499.1 50S ribosomal protein L15 [Corynebacterium sp. p3-SID1194]